MRVTGRRVKTLRMRKTLKQKDLGNALGRSPRKKRARSAVTQSAKDLFRIYAIAVYSGNLKTWLDFLLVTMAGLLIAGVRALVKR